MSMIIQALTTMVRDSHDVEGLTDEQRDSRRQQVVDARLEYDQLKAEIKKLRGQLWNAFVHDEIA